MVFLLVSAAAVLGALYILKDVPGGRVQRLMPNRFRSKPMDVA